MGRGTHRHGLILVSAVVGAVWASGARASDLLSRWQTRAHIHTSISLDYFSSDQALNNKRGFAGATGRFSAHPRLGDRLRGYVSGWVTDPRLNRAEGADTLIRQAYITKNWRDNQLRVGKQIVAWGQGDGINPTDNLTPRDYTVLQPSTADQRFGTSAVLWNHFIGRRTTLTTFVSPFFRPSIIAIPAIPGVAFENRIPGFRARHTEVALKWGYASGAGDWSVSYFHGFDLLPNLALQSVAPPIVSLNYNRLDVLGGDFTRPVGSRYLVWGEAAYFRPLNVSYVLPQTQKPNLFAVMGASRQLTGTASLSLQVVDRIVQDYVAPQSAPGGPDQEIAIQNALINGELHRNNVGTTAQITDSWWHQTLQGKFFAYVNVRPLDSLVRLTLTYAATDHIVFTVGGVDYMGPRESYFGQLATNRMVFVQSRYNLF